MAESHCRDFVWWEIEGDQTERLNNSSHQKINALISKRVLAQIENWDPIGLNESRDMVGKHGAEIHVVELALPVFTSLIDDIFEPEKLLRMLLNIEVAALGLI